MTEFEKIYRAYFSDVYCYIRRLSGDEQTAEEITSETFFKAMRAIGTFRGDCDIRVWLCQIAKNCYYTDRRKAERAGPLDAAVPAELPCEEETAEEKVLRQEDAAQLRRILHGIPEPYREVFMWRVFAELSFKQIGPIFGKSENWACVTYHRAKNMIQTRLEEQNHEK